MNLQIATECFNDIGRLLAFTTASYFFGVNSKAFFGVSFFFSSLASAWEEIIFLSVNDSSFSCRKQFSKFTNIHLLQFLYTYSPICECFLLFNFFNNVFFFFCHLTSFSFLFVFVF